MGKTGGGLPAGLLWIAESAISTAAAKWSGIRSTANGWIESTLCKNCRYRKSILRRPPFLRCGNRMDELWEPLDPAPVDRRAVPQRWEYRLRRAAGRTEKGICITDADAGTGFLPQNRFGTGIAGLPGRQRRFRAHDPKMWRNLCGRSAGAGRRWPAGTDSAVLDCAMK